MTDVAARKRIWGWMMFDWASQPYNTLLLTFIFAPYVKELMGDGSAAQAAWGFGIAAAGIVIAILSPILGSMADVAGNRLRWIWAFSVMYVVGAWGLWWAAPDDFDLLLTLALFGVGMIGMEFATVFTNSMLPDLGPQERIGRISGNGWAWGYLGGLVALVAMLALFAQDAATGRTFLGLDPALGLDAERMEGTRAVGPLTAVWYVAFMIPFFMWVRDPKPGKLTAAAVVVALRGLARTVSALPRTPSLFAYLGSSLFYRDALVGMYAFGGIYAAGVLDWSVPETGAFGIIAIVASALFAWIGGRADSRFGSKPVILVSILALIFVAVSIIFVGRERVFGFPMVPDSALPDVAFYVLGTALGAAGGVLQTSSRTMMAFQADPERMTEAFGLYALAGKATSFIAPAMVGAVTALTGSQQIGIIPLVALFLVGLVLLLWVKPKGDGARQWNDSSRPSWS